MSKKILQPLPENSPVSSEIDNSLAKPSHLEPRNTETPATVIRRTEVRRNPSALNRIAELLSEFESETIPTPTLNLSTHIPLSKEDTSIPSNTLCQFLYAKDTGPLGFQCVTSSRPEEASEEVKFLPASSILTPAGWESLQSKQPIVHKAEADIPPVLAYTRSMLKKEKESTQVPSIVFEFLDENIKRTWSEDELQLVEQVADQLSLALDNARLFEQTQSALKQTEILYQASAELNAVQSQDDILKTLRNFTLLGEADKSVSLILFNQPWNGPVMPEWGVAETTWPIIPGQQLKPRYPLKNFPSALLSPSRPTIIEDITTDLRLEKAYRTLLWEKYQAHSFVIVPLVAGGLWIGFIHAIYGQPKQFREADVRRLIALSRQAAVAVQNLRLLEEIRWRASQLQTAAEIARDTTSTLALEALLQRAVNLISERFGYYQASIFLLDETGTMAVVRESTGAAGAEMKRQNHSLIVGSQSIIGQVTQTGQALVLNDVTATEFKMIYRPSPLLLETRAELGIPLKIGERVIGALDVQSIKPDSFTEDDIAILQTLSDQIAIALDNARSYEIAQKAVEEIREADRLKSQFLANMSHELRTPLNSIIGFSRVILKGIDGPISELQQQDLTAIHNSGQHLLGLINDVLDLSKIEAGKMELAFEENVNLGEIITSVMSTTVGLVKDKPIKLYQEVAPNLPLVKVDPVKIRQVLLNLLSNAAKFTEEGSITVQAGTQANPEGRTEVIVRIIDTGPGIDQEKQQKLFQPFSQVDGSMTRKTGGTGLGLSICRHMIRMHEGQIGLESELGKGSTFFFTLPINGDKESATLEHQTIEKATKDRQNLAQNPASQRKEEVVTRFPDVKIQMLDNLVREQNQHDTTQNNTITVGQSTPLQTPSHIPAQKEALGLILAIDKEIQIIDLYQRYLTPLGYTMKAVSKLNQAVSTARSLQPTIITLDVAMRTVSGNGNSERGNIDGWQVLQQLKADPGTKNIPVIICSLATEKEKAFRMGASDFLIKPILEEDLASAIQRVINM